MSEVARPSGVVTFLFTDIEGSTRRWEADPDAMREALAAHDEVLSGSIEAHGGWMFKHTGDGVCAAFESPPAAVEAAVDAQRDLGLPVRMGIATGEAELRGEDYFGPALNRAARVMDAGHGGQILVASVAAALVNDVDLLDLGPRRLRDLSEPVGLFQVRSEGLRLEFPPLRTLDVTPGNLRPQATSFVGRQDELGEVTGAVRDHRMVTLTGVGGVGKTRLALQAAAELAPDFPDGVWLVELASVGHPEAVPDAVATGLGIVQQPGLSVQESIAAALIDRYRLLVLDNCEHVLDAAADLVEAILHASTTMKVMATSREGLRVADERVLTVPSLSVRAGAGSESVALFVDRAQALVGDFSLEGPEDREAAVEICQRLDGIPLAIELAASRMTSMSPPEVRDRLDDRFRLLSGSRRGLERHQTLRHAVQWSYDLLAPEEQELLNRCAVFAGGFDLDTAVAVAGSGADEYAMLDLLDALVRKSLLTADRSGGYTRYAMLETIRQFAEDGLVDSGQAPATRDSHAAYFNQELDEALQTWSSTEQRFAMEWFGTEFSNLRSAFRWAADQNDLDTAAAIAIRAAYPWSYELNELEPATWAEELLEPARVAEHHQLVALYAIAAQCGWAARLDDALVYTEAGLELIDDPRFDEVPVGSNRELLGQTYVHMGQPERWVELCQAHLDLYPDPHLVVRQSLVGALAVAGRIDEARLLAEETMEIARTEVPWFIPRLAQTYGFAFNDSDPESARDLALEALPQAIETGTVGLVRNLQLNVARAEARLGRLEAALSALAEPMSAWANAGGTVWLCAANSILAATLDNLGRHEAAAVAVGFAMRTPSQEFAWPELAAAIEHLKEVLGVARYEALAAEGASMSLAANAKFGLGEINRASATETDSIELTARQLEVAQLVARGLTNKAIAEKLDVSPYTVETHVRNILERLDATNRAQIVAWVMSNDPD